MVYGGSKLTQVHQFAMIALSKVYGMANTPPTTATLPSSEATPTPSKNFAKKILAPLQAPTVEFFKNTNGD
jgi:hypothetical protein